MRKIANTKIAIDTTATPVARAKGMKISAPRIPGNGKLVENDRTKGRLFVEA
jgi:hypothetical protein